MKLGMGNIQIIEFLDNELHCLFIAGSFSFYKLFKKFIVLMLLTTIDAGRGKYINYWIPSQRIVVFIHHLPFNVKK